MVVYNEKLFGLFPTLFNDELSTAWVVLSLEKVKIITICTQDTTFSL
jgi:hypothetical protein